MQFANIPSMNFFSKRALSNPLTKTNRTTTNFEPTFSKALLKDFDLIAILLRKRLNEILKTILAVIKIKSIR